MSAKSLLIAVGLIILDVAYGQTPTTAYPYTVDSSTIPEETRLSWCEIALDVCPVICGGGEPYTECFPNTLEYTCVCADGSSPNATEYMLTIPYFECQVYKSNCITNAGEDAQIQRSCIAIPCPSTPPQQALASALSLLTATESTTTTSSATSSGTTYTLW